MNQQDEESGYVSLKQLVREGLTIARAEEEYGCSLQEARRLGQVQEPADPTAFTEADWRLPRLTLRYQLVDDK